MHLPLFIRDIDRSENIWEAAEKGILSDVILYLKERPESLHLGNSFSIDWTPLHYATIHGHRTIVKYLLGLGAHVDALAFDMSTSLHYAAAKNYLGIMQLLLEAGANINALDRQKNSPLHYAGFYGHFTSVKYLLANGANTTLVNLMEKTPAKYAQIRGHKYIANYIKAIA